MVTQIIDTLATRDSLVKPLHQTLIFAKRIGNIELSTWVLGELNGYKQIDYTTVDDKLPSYRHARNVVMGVMRQYGRLTKEITLPLTCFGKFFNEVLSSRRFDENIATLERYLQDTDDKYVIKIFGADLCLGLTQQAKEGGYDFEVVTCREITTIAEIAGIVASIKTKLLELLLAVEGEYSTVDILSANAETKSQLNDKISYYVKNFYSINSSGEGTIINTGNNNLNEINNSNDKI